MISIMVRSAKKYLMPAAVIMGTVVLCAQCAKNISEDWRTEGWDDTILQVVVRVPLCEKGNLKKCRDDLNSTIQEAGRSRVALLLRAYDELPVADGDKGMKKRPVAPVPADGKIVRIHCRTDFCDALVEYTFPRPNS